MITITAQGTFNAAWKEFVIDHKPPSMDGPNCVYRGPNGSKCAIGLVIPDDEYEPSFEGDPVSYLIECGYVRVEGGENERHAVERIQDAHDMTLTHTGHTACEERMREIATEYNLTIPS